MLTIAALHGTGRHIEMEQSSVNQAAQYDSDA
jgi:hypothetical protein